MRKAWVFGLMVLPSFLPAQENWALEKERDIVYKKEIQNIAPADYFASSHLKLDARKSKDALSLAKSKRIFKNEISQRSGILNSVYDVSGLCGSAKESQWTLIKNQWHHQTYRQFYLQNVDYLIEDTAAELAATQFNNFNSKQTAILSNFIKALFWKESRWQHLISDDHTLGLIRSIQSYNALGDWGIGQIAMSEFEASKALNSVYFKHLSFCSLEESIAYASLVMFITLKHAQKLDCNQNFQQQLVGAYNRYSSGYSFCHNQRKNSDSKFKTYQDKSLKQIQQFQENKPWRKILKEKNDSFSDGAFIRGPKHKKQIALLFTSGSQPGNLKQVLLQLQQNKAKANFFFSGAFLRESKHERFISQIAQQGHEIGSHGDKHQLLYAWDRKKILVSKNDFVKDLQSSLDLFGKLGAKVSQFYLPPYEHQHSQHVYWAWKELGLVTIGYSRGTYSHADWTPKSSAYYKSTEQILKSIDEKANEQPDGLNGFHLLVHLDTPERKIKPLSLELSKLLKKLKSQAYEFVRLSEMYPDF